MDSRFAIHLSALTPRKIDLLLSSCKCDIEQSPFLFEFLFGPIIVHGSVREEILLKAGDKYSVKLEALRGMHGHEPHPLLSGLFAGKDILTPEEAATFEASENIRLNRDLYDPVGNAPGLY